MTRIEGHRKSERGGTEKRYAGFEHRDTWSAHSAPHHRKIDVGIRIGIILFVYFPSIMAVCSFLPRKNE